MKTLEELEAERMAWSLKVFTQATCLSSLQKLRDEIDEVETDVINGDDPTEEYVDCLMCLFDSAGRRGISVADLTEAFARKLAKNKARRWVKNSNNTYSHVK